MPRGRPERYRRYTGLLGTPFTSKDLSTAVFDDKFKELLGYYGIDVDDPERADKLLVCLMHRYVRGFQFHRTPGRKVERAFIAEIVDDYGDSVAERKGARPSVRQAVTRLHDSELADSEVGLRNMNPEYIRRIYNDRDKEAARIDRDFADASRQLAEDLSPDIPSSDDRINEYMGLFREVLRKRFG